MIRFATIAALVGGCVDSMPGPASCEPLMTIDDGNPNESHYVDLRAAVCVRIDTTALARPHIEVTGPSETGVASRFQVDLRDARNTKIAVSTDVMAGSGTYSSATWDPGGLAVYDVLVSINLRDPQPVRAVALVNVQLLAR